MGSSSKKSIFIDSSDEEEALLEQNPSPSAGNPTEYYTSSDEENPEEIIWKELGGGNPKFFKIFVMELMGKKLDVKVEYKDHYYTMTTGWPKFIKDNRVKFGDLLYFERTGLSQLDVDIFSNHACLKCDVYNGDRYASTSGAAVVAPTNAVVVHDEPRVPVPFYDLVVTEGHVKKKYLPVLKQFWSSRIASSKRTPSGKVTLRMGGRSWTVGLKKEKYKVQLAKNMQSFMEDNGLVHGDQLRFELADSEENLTMNVTLLK